MSAISIAHHQLAHRGLSCVSRGLQKTSTQRRMASMMAWKIHDSMDNHATVDIKDKLKCLETRVPTLSSPSDILVKVHATSVNPLDVRMCYGYGRRVLDLLDMFTNHEVRITNDRYPLTLGRDFSGEVMAVGPSCVGVYQKGDHVFGAIPPHRSGAHAQYVTVPANCVTKKPGNLTHEEAASVPFIGLTAHSALCCFGGLSEKNCKGKSVLVLGGSGGVGSFSIQLLKLWGANVIATSSADKMDYLENTLFVDQAVDYNDLAQMNNLTGRFDFVLDCGDYDRTHKQHQDIVSDGTRYLKPMSQSVYVTLSPPILRNTDQRGIVLGSAQTALEVIQDTLVGLRNFNSARWAVFLPNKRALDYISGLYEEQAIAAQVHSVHGFDRLPTAYEELQSGLARGKVIVDATKGNETRASDSSSKNSTSGPRERSQ